MILYIRLQPLSPNDIFSNIIRIVGRVLGYLYTRILRRAIFFLTNSYSKKLHFKPLKLHMFSKDTSFSFIKRSFMNKKHFSNHSLLK